MVQSKNPIPKALISRCCYCIVADESRSCSVDVSTNPVYLTNPRICGTNEQPWTLEAAFGQKISVDLVMHRQSTRNPQILQSHCRELGTIVDGAAKRNTTICANEEETQTTTIYKSTGNTLQIFLDSSSKQENPIGKRTNFFMKLHGLISFFMLISDFICSVCIFLGFDIPCIVTCLQQCIKNPSCSCQMLDILLL